SDVGVFRSVDVRAEPRADDPGLRDVVVGLVDKPDVQVEYGVRYTTQGEGSAGGAPSSPSEARWQLAGAVELVNPFGFGVKTRAYGFGTTSRQSWGLNLDAATLAGWRLRSQLFFFNDNDDDTEIAGLVSHVRGVTAQQSRVLLRDRRGRRWHERLRLQWGYTFKDIEYVESAEPARTLQGDRGFLSLAAIGDERDNLTDPRRGVFWTGTSELARTWLASDVDYVRLYGQLFAYVPVGPLVWAQGYRVGAVPGTDPLLLLEKRFHAGGPTTVRGYEQNALGPQTVEGDALGGQAVVVLNQELRFPIAGKLKGGLFWDAGNVWQTSSELDLGDLRHSAGAGLRYIFPFGPIRIEYAWILGRRAGEPAGRFVFGLGHAF
ncbi:MAG TPA: outer membrane protein assembly factor, partial [Vicinamibacteria bacterium]|nr:outer membrane protein assembly factor [Vicinamibacteria bacterium]